MGKKVLLRSSEINKVLAKCKMYPHKNIVEKILVEVNNEDFYLGRSSELIGQLRYFHSQGKETPLLHIKMAEDIIKHLTIFIAYKIKRHTNAKVS